MSLLRSERPVLEVAARRSHQGLGLCISETFAEMAQRPRTAQYYIRGMGVMADAEFSEQLRQDLPRLSREHPRCARRCREIFSVKASFANDVYFVVDFRQGQVAIDGGEVDGVGQVVCLC